MYKLMVVGGPSKGTSYPIRDGENSIGRVAGNDIVLSSQKVSKKHCVLVVNNDQISVKDAGSSNGTFVNGVLTKLKRLVAGDRVSVGEFVLEVRVAERPQQAVALVSDTSNVIPFTGHGLPITGAPITSSTPIDAGVPKAEATPQTLQEKIKFYFEQYVINFVYNLNERYEWRVLMASMFVVITVVGAVLSVYPVLDRVRSKLMNEATYRALLMARQIVERNAAHIYGQTESKTDVAFIESEIGVKSAYLLDMDGRIIAPARKLNQHLSESPEGAFSAAARAAFAEKVSSERYVRGYGDLVAVAVPMRVFNQSTGKNDAVALGVVFFNRAMIVFDEGTEMLSYIQGVILSGIIAVIIFFSLYRLTLRPLLALNDDIDQVLKGNAAVVNKKYKMEEIDPLIDVVNSALQRAAASAGGVGSLASSDQVSFDDLVATLKFASEHMSTAGMIVFSADRRIMHLNPYMEEVTGMRNDSSRGSDIGSAARDSAFVSFVEDILSRSTGSTGEVMSEDFEFSGTTYRMECIAVGQSGAVRGFVLTALKQA